MNELHRDEDQIIGFLHRIEVHDIGMIERRRGSRFPLKERETIDGSGDLQTGKLERHPSVEPRVVGDGSLPCRRCRATQDG